MGPPNHPFVPLRAIVAYGVLANTCYSTGRAVETVLQKWLGRETYGLGPALDRHGFVFSVGLTLLPVLPMTVETVGYFFGVVH